MLTDTLPKLHFAAADGALLHYVKETRRYLRIGLCALHGHELMFHFERGRRVCLRCPNCGYETPGWSTK
jgi:hypothetical protein